MTGTQTVVFGALLVFVLVVGIVRGIHEGRRQVFQEAEEKIRAYMIEVDEAVAELEHSFNMELNQLEIELGDLESTVKEIARWPGELPTEDIPDRTADQRHLGHGETVLEQPVNKDAVIAA